MKAITRRHPIAVFLVLAYGAAAAIFALPLLAANGIGIIDLELPGMAPFILLAAFALAGAAFVTTALAEGRAGVRSLRRRVFHFRVRPTWYVLALLLLPGVALISTLPFAGIAPIAKLIGSPDLVLGVVILGALVAFLLVNWWEEVGWTGFVLDRLQRQIGPMGASVVTTWLQALIHVPLVFVAGGVTAGRVPMEQIPFYLVALFVLPIPVRLMLTWLYNTSGRSLPIVGLSHAGLGVATGTAFIPVIAPGVAPVVVYAGFAVLAAILVIATRGRLGYDAQEPEPQIQGEVAMAS